MERVSYAHEFPLGAFHAKTRPRGIYTKGFLWRGFLCTGGVVVGMCRPERRVMLSFDAEDASGNMYASIENE